MKSESSNSAIPGIERFRQLYALFFEQQDAEKTEKAMRIWMRREPGFQTFVLGHLLYGCLMQLHVHSKIQLSAIAKNEAALNSAGDRQAEMVASALSSIQEELVALRETVELLSVSVNDSYPTDELPGDADQDLTEGLVAILQAGSHSEVDDTTGHHDGREFSV